MIADPIIAEYPHIFALLGAGFAVGFLVGIAVGRLRPNGE